MNSRQRAALSNPNLEFAASTFLGQPVGPNQMLKVFQDQEGENYYEKKVLFNCNDGAVLGPQGRSDLILIVLPSNLDSLEIADGFLQSCEVLETIVGVEDLTEIPAVFAPGCIALKFSKLNAEVINQSAFAECTALERVELPNVQTMDTGVFAGCVNATIVLNDSVESVGEAAFGGIDNLIYHGSLPGAPWGAQKWNGVPQN